MQLTVPSGRTFHDDDLQLLPLLTACGFIRWSNTPFTLKSGRESHVYVFGRNDLTDNPLALFLTGKRIVRAIREHLRPENQRICLIGIPTAGTALAVAASMAHHVMCGRPTTLEHQGMGVRIMRTEQKTHGAHGGWIDGTHTAEFLYCALDNVVTDGASKVQAARRMVEDGYPGFTMPNLILVDRQQGGIAKMQEAGFTDVHVVYNLLDLTYAFGELDLWPKDAARRVEEEIAAHQVT